MSELSYDPSPDIVRSVATFLSRVATSIASATLIATLLALFGKESSLDIKVGETVDLVVFAIPSLLLSVFILGLSCFVLSLLSKVEKKC
jgi:hypothetical protein